MEDYDQVLYIKLSRMTENKHLVKDKLFKLWTQ